MSGDFILVYLDFDDKPTYGEAFDTEPDAEKRAESAPSDVDVWLVRARSAGARLLRERATG